MSMRTIYLIFLCATQNEGRQLNLALHKRAYLSSVSNESHARYAVDGNAFETFAQASNIKDSGWFVVDLGRPYRVESIIYHRPDCLDCDPDFLGNNNVIVGLSNNFDPEINITINRDYKPCGQHHGSLPYGVKMVLQCQDKKAYSRYVIVRQVGKEFLTISELMVMGEYINYIGCFTRLQNSKTVGLNLSLENCINKCENLNYVYAGIQVTRCICGNETKNYSPLSECNVLCHGDVDYCGSSNKISVYEDGGSSFSRSNHHCKDGADLDLDGICGNKQCEGGWTGEDCSVRDCSVNNGDCEEHVCRTLHGTTGVFSECICSEGFDKNFWWDYCHGNLFQNVTFYWLSS